MKAQQQATLPKSPDQRRAQYHAYLRTPEWQAKRLAALERADHRCQLCNGSKRLNVHHRTYERIFHEQPGDLTVLCEKCHEHFHTKRFAQPSGQATKPKGKKKKATLPAAPTPNATVTKLERRLQERDPIRRAAVEAQQRQYEERRAEKAAERERLKAARVTVTAEIKARNAGLRKYREKPEPPLELDPVEVERYGLYMAKMSARARRQVLREAA